jgi:acyl-CoA thioester hydrolase
MNAGRVFVVVHAEVDYRAPARYGETLEIETIVSELSPAAITFSHVVRDRESRRLVVEGSARLAVTDGNGKVKRLDKSTVAALQSSPPEC